MKKQKKGFSLIEVLVVMMIVSLGTSGAFALYFRSQDVSYFVKNRLVATAIAREGIEAMINIRDTNLMLFGSNPNKCWNVLNYETTITEAQKPTRSCLFNGTSTYIANTSYTLNVNRSNKRWQLNNFNTANLIVKQNADGFYCQGASTDPIHICYGYSPTSNPQYTRELKISYQTESGAIGTFTDPFMQVESIVKWQEKGQNREVNIKTIIANTGRQP